MRLTYVAANAVAANVAANSAANVAAKLLAAVHVTHVPWLMNVIIMEDDKMKDEETEKLISYWRWMINDQ